MPSSRGLPITARKLTYISTNATAPLADSGNANPDQPAMRPLAFPRIVISPQKGSSAMKSSPFSKFWAAIFRLISADAAASVPAFGQGEGAGTAEASCRKRRTGWTLRPWVLGVCAALLLLGWPMRGYSQTPVATVGAGSFPLAVAVNPVTNKI